MWGGVGADEYASLVGTLDRIESAGCELVEMVMADGDSWDRYSAAQWMALSDWLRDNPSDPEAGAIYEKMAADRRSYLEFARRYYGWGVFVMRVW